MAVRVPVSDEMLVSLFRSDEGLPCPQGTELLQLIGAGLGKHQGAYASDSRVQPQDH